MFQAVIFDFDGVLADSLGAYIKVFKKVLFGNGIKTTVKELKSHFGENVTEIFLSYTSKANRAEDTQKLVAQFYREICKKEFLGSIKLFPHTKEVLEKLREMGFLTAIASGTTSRLLKQHTDALGISGYFDKITGSDEVRHSKPSPEILIKTLESLRVSQERALYIGDAKYDVLAARSAGIACAVVLTGALTKREAEALSPQYILKDLGQIFIILQG